MNHKKIRLVLVLATLATLSLSCKQNPDSGAFDLPKIENQNFNLNSQTQPTQPGQSISSSIQLPVPFTPQAPTANWDELHNEACEEASSLMADAYFKGMKDTTLKTDYAEGEIDKLTNWQQKNQGYYLDQTSDEVAKMVREVYGLKTELINNFTENDLKKALSEGKLAIISFNGRMLGNPNYKQPGPLHHMIVVRGYDSRAFITNDPGTRRGLNYRYNFSTLFTAAGDWNHATHDVDTNKKIAIIVWK